VPHASHLASLASVIEQWVMPKDTDKPNIVLVVLAVLVTAAAIANAISAVNTDAVWTLSARGLSMHQTQRSSDPFSFYVVLIAGTAFAIYLDWDLWRRYRNLKRG
jgi:hypothetical protein